MATWEDVRLVDKGVTQSKGDVCYMLSETPFSNGNLTGSFPITPSLVSTLTSATCIQHAMDVGRLQQELKNVQKDLDGFQQKTTENLQKVEDKLSCLMDVVSRLETRSHGVELRLTAEENRGIARSQVLTFLLPREKELRGKCGVLEKALFKKNAWLKNAGLSNRGDALLETSWNCIEKRRNRATLQD